MFSLLNLRQLITSAQAELLESIPRIGEDAAHRMHMLATRPLPAIEDQALSDAIYVPGPQEQAAESETNEWTVVDEHQPDTDHDDDQDYVVIESLSVKST